jgi:hypothetical protein
LESNNQQLAETDKLTQQDIIDVIKFASDIYAQYPYGVFTPELSESILQDLNNNPQVPTNKKAKDALISYKNQQELLQAYSEFMEVYNRLYNRVVEYYANMLSFDLNFSCKNAYSPETDYNSKEYKDDIRRVYKFLDMFKYKEQFHKVIREVLRHETYFTWFRTSNGTVNNETESLDKVVKYSLQTLPQKYCKTTRQWENGFLFDFNMTYFTKAGVDINSFDPIFKKYYRDVFINDKDRYNPTEKLNRIGGVFALWHQTSPDDGAWEWKFNDTSALGVPMLASLIPQFLTNDEVAKLQVDKDMISAKAILAGEIQTLEKQKSGNSTDAMVYKMNTLLKLLALVKRGLANNINAVAMPTASPHMYQFSDSNKDMVANQLKNSAGISASASRLIYCDDKMSAEEIENAIISDYNIVSKMYRQFENFLNFYVNKKTRKYKFSFIFSGSTYPFIRDKEVTNLFKLADKGINLAPRTYAKVLNITPQDFDRLLEEGKYSQWTETLLSSLVSINTQSMKNTDPNIGGRPQIDKSDIADTGNRKNGEET